MRMGRRLWVAAALVALTGAGAAFAQTGDAVALLPPVRGLKGQPGVPYPVPAGTAEGVLAGMAARASVIFVGTVAAVRVPLANAGAGGGASGGVEVEFAVEEWLRQPDGWTTSYVVKEWAGLWRDGPRYAVGQRRLMLLHAPGASGLSSPVDGMNGAIPIVAGVAAKQPTARTAGAAKATGSGGVSTSFVDLRWVQARELRVAVDPETDPASSAQTSAGAGGTLAENALAGSSAARMGPRAMAPLGAPGESTQPELGYVLSLLVPPTAPGTSVAEAALSLPTGRESQDAGR
jgi:hypothetical protein